MRQRSPAPDIAACILILFACSMIFPLLRALFATSRGGSAALPSALAYIGLLSVCAALGRGLFLRHGYAAPAALIALAIGLIASVTGFYVSETAQLPLGMLCLFGAALILGALPEFRPASADGGPRAQPKDDDDDDDRE